MASPLSLLKGQPLVTKLAWVATYVVLPGSMAAALVYSPPDFVYRKKLAAQSSSSSSK